jgi:peroxiredoxin
MNPRQFVDIQSCHLNLSDKIDCRLALEDFRGLRIWFAMIIVPPLSRFACLAAAAALVLATPADAAPQPPPVLATGSALPAFALPDTEGKVWKDSDFGKAKLLCLIFTCNHCPDAYAARARIRQIHEDYHQRGVAVVAVSTNNPAGLRPDELGYSPYGDSFAEMKPFAAENGWAFPYLYDGEKQELGTACGAQATPHVFVFDAQRKLRYNGRMDDARRDPGPVETSFLRDALDALLAGGEVATPVTRPFGCSTKWLWKNESVAADQKAWEAKPVTLEPLDPAGARKLRANGGGNVRLINIWSTTCAPCVAEFPDLVETYRRFQNRPFDMVTVSLDPPADKDKVMKFLTGHHAALSDRTKPSLAKEGRTSNNHLFAGANPDELAEALDPEWGGALPHSILLAPGGEILWRHTGRVEPVELRRAIVDALARL